CRPVEACGPVIGRIRPILTASCAPARSAAANQSATAADAVTSPLRNMRFLPRIRLSCVDLYVEEDRLALPLEADVETIHRVSVIVATLRDQGCTAFLRHERENGIAVVLRVGEIEPRIVLAQHAAGKYGDDNMRSLRPIGARDRARLDGLERIGAALLGSGAAEALEGRIGVRTLIGRMRVAPAGIGLPD